jgi:8-oxo-dGTP diphosphatase
VLLVRRGTEPLKGEWSLPGGAVDLGERLQQGIAREVLEETGLQVQPIEVAGVIDRIFVDPAGKFQYHYVLIDYLCRVNGGELLAGSDAQDVRWFTVDQLEELRLERYTDELIRKLLKEKRS